MYEDHEITNIDNTFLEKNLKIFAKNFNCKCLENIIIAGNKSFYRFIALVEVFFRNPRVNNRQCAFRFYC